MLVCHCGLDPQSHKKESLITKRLRVKPAMTRVGFRFLTHRLVFSSSFSRQKTLVAALLFSTLASFSQEATFLFAGDAMQHQSQINAAYRNGCYDYSSYFPYIEYEVSQADLSFVNLEVSLGGKPFSGYPSFSAPDEYAVALKDAGFDVFLTANNHILDKGSKGLLRTLSVLDSLQVEHTGSFRNRSERSIKYPLFIEKNGFRIAVLNYTYGTNGITVKPPLEVNYIEKQAIRDDIAKARKSKADVIIVCMHWGAEYKLLPNKEQTDLADFLLNEKVDLIIGAHPHVVQPMKLIKDQEGVSRQAVVYSLGNLISGMRAPNTDGGLLFKVTIKKEKNQIRIQSAGYILVYKHQQKNGDNIDFQAIPVSLSETPTYLLPKAYQVGLETKEQEKLMIFARNARLVLNKHNQDVPEYQIRIKQPNEKIPIKFGYPFFDFQKNIIPLPRK